MPSMMMRLRSMPQHEVAGLQACVAMVIQWRPLPSTVYLLLYGVLTTERLRSQPASQSVTKAVI